MSEFEIVSVLLCRTRPDQCGPLLFLEARILARNADCTLPLLVLRILHITAVDVRCFRSASTLLHSSSELNVRSVLHIESSSFAGTQ